MPRYEGLCLVRSNFMVNHILLLLIFFKYQTNLHLWNNLITMYGDDNKSCMNTLVKNRCKIHKQHSSRIYICMYIIYFSWVWLSYNFLKRERLRLINYTCLTLQLSIFDCLEAYHRFFFSFFYKSKKVLFCLGTVSNENRNFIKSCEKDAYRNFDKVSDFQG